jgi:hypothetical protein
MIELVKGITLLSIVSTTLISFKKQKMKKYRNYKVESASSPSYPEMVSVTLKNGVVKKFVTPQKAELWIEEQIAIRAINSGAKEAKAQLMDMGLVPFEFKTA